MIHLKKVSFAAEKSPKDVKKGDKHQDTEEKPEPVAGSSAEKDDDGAVEMIRKYMAEKLGFLDKKEDNKKKASISDKNLRHFFILILKVLDEVSVDAVVRYIKSGDCKNILVMAGAGISTSAGIPDFRSPGSGLYDNLAKYDLPHPQVLIRSELILYYIVCVSGYF